MKELKVSDAETKEFFVHAFCEENLVPILGAGFTCGLKTKKGGEVPSGKKLKEDMIKQIVRKKEVSEEELKHESFTSISEFYQQTFAHPDKDGVIDYYMTNFTGIEIDKPQQLKFLNDIKWPYIYTLNIDTAIEDSKKQAWEVFYPNRRFDPRKINPDCGALFKIHGDVAMFCKNLDYNEMILTESQYIASLEKSKQFHDLLSADCGNKNLLYIGCSLDDEIDIKYSVLSDKNKNMKNRNICGIYVTSECLSEFKKSKLESYNISHVIQLSSIEDYEYFYEFVTECYDESQAKIEKNITQFSYVELERLKKNKEENLDYLADLSPDKNKLPFYFVSTKQAEKIKFLPDKINIIVGRRFVGKSMLAHTILEANPNYQRFFVSEKETITENDIKELLLEKNSLIVFDSQSLDDRGFNSLLSNFDSERNNIVCVFLNSFDDVVNLITFHSKSINYAIKDTLRGKMPQDDILAINDKLNTLGISKFDQKRNLLDNTLRIANVYNRKVIEKYVITDLNELTLIIWILVKNKIYYEELVGLGLTKDYKKIVLKYMPLIQEENCKKGELRKHSHIKVICNGKLGLLQILSAYIYPPDGSEIKYQRMEQHQNKVCEAIYKILSSFSKIDIDNVKEFLQFDKLNDIFSRTYSASSIGSMSGKKTNGIIRSGAANFIYKVYENENIKQLKADDPNYWLQRAKSIYITNYRSTSDSSKDKILEAIDWAKKAEQDSRMKIDSGESRYLRTESNAIMQIAMLYGKYANMCKYIDTRINEFALEYYYKMFSDTNNIEAAKTFLYHSRGKQDFDKLLNQLVVEPDSIGKEWGDEMNFLLNIGIIRQ